MDSAETINLPLTTTKKGIDATSDVYKAVLVFMKEALLSIIPFFKQVTKLGNEANDFRKLLGEQESKLSVVEMKTIVVADRRQFTAPEVNSDRIAEKKDTIRISYDAKKNAANKAKYHSGSRSYKELGELTFQYYLKMEDIEDE